MKIYTSNQEQRWFKLQSQRCVNTMLRGLNSNCCYNGTYLPVPILKHPPMGNTQLPICNCDKTVEKWGFLGHLHVHQSTVIKNIFLIFLNINSMTVSTMLKYLFLPSFFNRATKYHHLFNMITMILDWWLLY